MSNILTYPWAARYSSNVAQYKTEVKDGKNGSIPFNDEIHYGDQTQNIGGVNWVSSSAGSDQLFCPCFGTFLSKTFIRYLIIFIRLHDPRHWSLQNSNHLGPFDNRTPAPRGERPS